MHLQSATIVLPPPVLAATPLPTRTSLRNSVRRQTDQPFSLSSCFILVRRLVSFLAHPLSATCVSIVRTTFHGLLFFERAAAARSATSTTLPFALLHLSTTRGNEMTYARRYFLIRGRASLRVTLSLRLLDFSSSSSFTEVDGLRRLEIIVKQAWLFSYSLRSSFY